ncbi:MAG TPA: HD domain-containing protein [Balneolales bacterium]|nr:HD domain-containing protein [Balneolales bacterium]
MISRSDSEQLMKEYIENENLQHHCYMVAAAMEEYARELNLSDGDIEEWWTAGLLHDLDWEKYPDEHPNKAVNDILPEKGYSEAVIEAIKAHAPERTGKKPETDLDRYLFACDEISGFMNAVSLMRPNGFQDMKVKSVTKKLKDKKFAENVSRDDIKEGAKLINKELRDHILFLINVFKNKP